MTPDPMTPAPITPAANSQRDAIAMYLAKYRQPTQYGYGPYAKGMQGLGEALGNTAPMTALRADIGQAFTPTPQQDWVPPPRDI